MFPTNSEEELKRELITQLNKSNRIIVRIWTSKINIHRSGENVGHISIELPNGQYLSFWPTETGKIEGYGIVKPIEHEFKPNFDKDVESEGRHPELTLEFYTLSVDKMLTKLHELQQQRISGWSLSGSILVQDAYSCASAAWTLLKAGDIDRLISRTDQSLLSSRDSSQGWFLSSIFSFCSSYNKMASNPQLARHNLEQSTQATLYSTEMAVSPVVNSPDYIGVLLERAKANEDQRAQITLSPEEHLTSWQRCTIS